MNDDHDDEERYAHLDAPRGADPDAGMDPVTDAELDDLIARGQSVVRASGAWGAEELSVMFADADLDDPDQRELLREQIIADLGLEG